MTEFKPQMAPLKLEAVLVTDSDQHWRARNLFEACTKASNLGVKMVADHLNFNAHIGLACDQFCVFELERK